MRQPLVWISTASMLVYGSALLLGADADDLDALLAGVSEIDAPGVPGPLCVYGPEAFPVIVGRTGQGSLRAPVMAAGRWQAGRVVVLGHGGYFDRATLDTAHTGRLITNALRWAADEGAQAGPRIGVVSDVGRGELRAWLQQAGHDATEVRLTQESLSTVDVVALDVWNQSVPELDALSSFVHAGGGLVTASTGWGWAQLHPDLNLVNDYAGNRLLASVGIQWPYDWLQRTSQAGYAVDGPPPELTHAGRALDAFEAHVAGTRVLAQPEVDQATDSLIRAVDCLPPADTLLAPRLHALVENSAHWPSAERPLGTADKVARLAAKIFASEERRSPPESVRAHPAASDFPGSVAADAPRVTRTLTIDTTEPRGHSTGPYSWPRAPRWHSTGLYAAPGELVTVTVPLAAVYEAGGFHVRVGAHSDTIWHRPEWQRMPEISRRFPISAATTVVANAFGGLIYVEVPADTDLGTITVQIEGAVAAPRFVLGETNPADWRDEIRHAPAPWAEIEGRNMIVTTDSREVRDLDNPAAVAKVWDRVLDLNAELAAWPSPVRLRPERFVVDRQISSGYMHAGYPLMAHMDQAGNLVDAPHLSACRNWGFIHEVGHLHQSDDWTFDGTVEVTVNLFTLYVYEFLCGIPVAENSNGSAAFRAEQMARYDFDNPDFEQWKREPFLALVMYEQLQQAFGWEAYRQVFATYRALQDDERPKSDAEKRDQWLMRFSRQVGRNLGPFFEAWGVPTSRSARASIADLPAWLPPELPVAADFEPSFGTASISDQSYVSGTAINPLTLPAASGGDSPLAYSLQPSVPGLSFDSRERQLSGTPTSTGTYSMRFSVRDSDGDTATLRFTITVQPSAGTAGAKRYSVDDRITTLPTGFWTPDVTSGGSFQYSAGTATVRLNNGGYVEEGDYRYTCASSGGCEVVNGTVTKGVVVESTTGDSPSGEDDHGDVRSSATGLTLGVPVTGRIDPGSDVDYFRLRLSSSAAVAIYTTGSLDTVGSLQDATGSRVDSDDDGGQGSNFRLDATLSAGTHYVEVGSYRSGTGSYTLHVERRGTGTDPAPPSGGDYTPLDGWTVSSGRVQFLFFSAGRCINLTGGTVNGVTYTVHTSKWQHRSGPDSEWTDIPGTENTDGAICSYSPTDPGEYRGVAEISIGGESGHYSTSNVLTVGSGSGSQGSSGSSGQGASDLSPVTGLEIVRRDDDAVLTWDPVSGAEYYKVYHCQTATSDIGPCELRSWWDEIAERVTGTTYRDSGRLESSVIPWRHYYQVRPCDQSGCLPL